MINRNLVRLKVIQIAYAAVKNEATTTAAALEELRMSFDKAYELYQYLLMLIVDVTDYAKNTQENINERSAYTGIANNRLARLANNRLAQQLSENETLKAFSDKKETHRWAEADGVARRLFKELSTSSLYDDYVAAPDNYSNDCKFWIRAYKRFIVDNDLVEDVLEDWSIYWNGDKETIDTFVIKTLKQFDETNGATQPLLPMFRNEDDRIFGFELLEQTLVHRADYTDLVEKRLKGWDLGRIPCIELVILLCAVTEIINQPTVAVAVTVNEYINFCKRFSSPEHVGFVNGVLDNIVSQLRDEGIISK